MKSKNDKFKLFLRNETLNEKGNILTELKNINDKNIIIEKDIKLDNWLP